MKEWLPLLLIVTFAVILWFIVEIPSTLWNKKRKEEYNSLIQTMKQVTEKLEEIERRKSMKITVNANDFCPDNCPYCEVQETASRVYGGGVVVTRECKWADFCKYIYELKGKNAEAEEAEQ